MTSARGWLLTAVAGAMVMMLSPGCAHRTGGAGAGEQQFADPKAAVDALLGACRKNDEATLLAIFGEQAKPIISTGRGDVDRERCSRLVTAADQMTRLDPKGADTVELVVGADDWPFPIPIVKDGSRWRFDVAAGLREIRKRRIGKNEIEAIDICREYVHAQRIYESRPRVGGRKAYAQKLVSTPGAKDGLYWPSTGTRDASPLGPLAAAEVQDATGTGPHGAWSGYYFRILTAQGAAAPGGARSYLDRGQMTRGFALVAYPAVYESTGIMTLIVGPDGIVYQKDLGPQTQTTATAMTAYDPDSTWKRIAG